MIDTGQVYHATLTIRNQASPPTTSALVITLPDQSTLTPALGPGTASGTDWVLSYDYLTTQAGLHKAAWTTQGPGTAATDFFNVRAFASILGLAEAKAHLTAGVATAWTADDDELRNFLAAVTEVVESKAGACVRRTVTQRVSDGHYSIVLAQRPVISVTSVTSLLTGGVSWGPSQLILDGDAGIISIQIGAVPFYYGPWDVTYQVGRVIIPERILHAAKELLRHLWDTQRGQLAAPVLGGGETYTTQAGWSFSIPRRVLELLSDDMSPAV